MAQKGRRQGLQPRHMQAEFDQAWGVGQEIRGQSRTSRVHPQLRHPLQKPGRQGCRIPRVNPHLPQLRDGCQQVGRHVSQALRPQGQGSQAGRMRQEAGWQSRSPAVQREVGQFGDLGQ